MMPNFLGLGAAKAGTTSVREYLNAHNQIYMAPGEPRFFSFEDQELDPHHVVHRTTITDLCAYQKLFDGVTDEKAIGDISPSYLFNPRAPERIKHHVPDAKLFVILRNPVDRAFSHFVHMIKAGLEPETDFAKAIDNPLVKVGNWQRTRYYIQFGFYHDQISRYFQLFSREQIRVYLFEDLKNDPGALMHDLFVLLGVDDRFSPDSSRVFNPSGVPRSRLVHSLLFKPNVLKQLLKFALPAAALNRLKGTAYQFQQYNLRRLDFPEETRAHLTDIYREDILNLQQLIQRDLSMWLE